MWNYIYFKKCIICHLKCLICTCLIFILQWKQYLFLWVSFSLKKMCTIGVFLLFASTNHSARYQKLCNWTVSNFDLPCLISEVTLPFNWRKSAERDLRKCQNKSCVKIHQQSLSEHQNDKTLNMYYLLNVATYGKGGLVMLISQPLSQKRTVLNGKWKLNPGTGGFFLLSKLT